MTYCSQQSDKGARTQNLVPNRSSTEKPTLQLPHMSSFCKDEYDSLPVSVVYHLNVMRVPAKLLLKGLILALCEWTFHISSSCHF